MKVPHLLPDQLDEAQRLVYAAIVKSPRAATTDGRPPVVPVTDDRGRLEGPFNAMLFHPRLGLPLQRLGVELRYGGVLPTATRELLVLTVANALDSAYEWNAHLAIANEAGLSSALIEAIRLRKRDTIEDPLSNAAYGICVSLIAAEAPDPTDLVIVEESHGLAGLFEITALVGYYRLLAQQLALFEPSSDSA